MESPQNQCNKSSRLLPEIRYGILEHLDIYQITDGELKTLEEGAKDSLCITLATSLLGVAVAFTIALKTATLPDRAFYVFVVMAVAGAIAGVILLCVGIKMWWKNHKKIKDLVQGIRNRIPPSVQEIDSEIIEPSEPTTKPSPM